MKAAYLLFSICLVLLGASCSEKAGSEQPTPGQGCVTFAIDTPHTRAETDDEQYPWSRCAIRIYKHTRNAEGASSKELIRRYNSRRELPEALWLLTGDYSIAVELGDAIEASFDRPLYRGEQEFTITEGTTTVEVECRVANTIVKVVYDPTVAATFKESYSTTVAFDRPAGWETSASVAGPYLTFDKTATGYFLLPEETSTLDWYFCGSGEKDGTPLELKTTGSKAIETTPGLCYELKLKYSKDLGGFLDFTLSLDESLDEIDDPITFVPNPQIAGVGFDMGEPQRFDSAPLAFTVASIGDMERVRIEVAGMTYEVPAATAPENADGITVACADEANLTVTLGARFFAQLPGGDNALQITAIDRDGGEGEKTLTVRTSGALAPTADPWFDDLKWRACILRATTAATLEYRYQGQTEWSTAELTQTGDDIYTTALPLARIGTRCEYRLLLDGVPTGAVQDIAYPQGPQVYNAGFEIWTGSSPLLPYMSENSDQWWDTGNHGSATLNVNVTTKANDARPGSSGTTSAKLQSQKVAMLGLGKFAAGNIFVGKYLATDGTDGVIGFGKPFAFTYRPKALRFWYKGTAGTVDNAGGSVGNGDSDVNQVYICLCKMGGPHVVATKRSDTFLDFAANHKTMPYCTSLDGKSSTNDRSDGHIIAWAEWNNTQSMAEWTEITLDLHYNEEYEGEVPTFLMLTASASKYGDYFAGSTSSTMYLDDMELVY